MNDSNRIKHEPAGFDRAPRRLLPLAAAIALSAAALAGCLGGGTVDATATAQASTSTEPETTTAAALPNPMREVTDVLAFEALGVHMVAPAKGAKCQVFHHQRRGCGYGIPAGRRELHLAGLQHGG